MRNYIFDGESYDAPRDAARLSRQHAAVFGLMRDGKARTLGDIATLTGAPQQSVSARLRDLRKPRFGGHTVVRAHLRDGVFVYRLVLAAPDTQQELF